MNAKRKKNRLDKWRTDPRLHVVQLPADAVVLGDLDAGEVVEVLADMPGVPGANFLAVKARGCVSGETKPGERDE